MKSAAVRILAGNCRHIRVGFCPDGIRGRQDDEKFNLR